LKLIKVQFRDGDAALTGRGRHHGQLVQFRRMNSQVTQPAATAPGSALAGRTGVRGNRGDSRRRRIFKSLHDCIIRKGYVKTTLADIARDAGMTASHLLYYFNGKEDILEQYFANVAIRFLERIESFSACPLQERIGLLADFWFRGEASTRQEIGFMLECFGAAVNDDVLKVTKADFDSRCKAHLTDFFLAAPAPLLEDPKDSAEIAYATMIGLRSAVYFDDDICLERAHGLFMRMMYRLCGFEFSPDT
jgi:AcrR family transcriptional regulator